ncbi:MAG: PulJ/GspJ family protein [Acidimicrobiales bacterium]
MTRSRGAGEAGFTLIELLIAMSISGLIMTAIVAAVVVGVNDTGVASSQLSQSDDRQLLQIWLPRDALSAQNTTNNVGQSTCAQGMPSGSTVVLVLNGSGVTLTTTAQGGPANVASYAYESDYVFVPITHHLLRYYCPAGGTSTTGMPVGFALNAVSATIATASGVTTVTMTATDTSGNTFSVASSERS